MAEADVETVRRAYETLAADDPVASVEREEGRARLDGLIARFTHDDHELVPMMALPDQRPRAGRTGLLEFFAELAEVWDEWRMDPTDFVAGQDGDVVVLIRITARGKGSGAEVSLEPAHVVTVRDGKISRIKAFLDREEALAAAGLTRGAEGA